MSGQTDTTPSWRAFELRVVKAYDSLGYKVIHNTELGVKQTDLVARLDTPGSPPTTLAVECKAHAKPIGEEIVSNFVASVMRRRETGSVTAGVLVSLNGFTAKGRAAATDHRYILLLTWDELISQVVDIRPRMDDLVTSYEEDPIYTEYLSLDVEALTWSDLVQPARETMSVDRILYEWLRRADQAQGPNILVMLGDFGSGKTTLLRRVAYDRAKAYQDAQDLRIPLYVPLRNYRDTHDVPQLLRASFRETYYRDIAAELLWQRVQDGMFYLLLDGFDEMTDKSDPARRLEHFLALSPALRSPSATIITSRPSYFVARGELDDMLTVLRKQETALAPAVRVSSTPAVNRMRRRLLARRREGNPPRAYDAFHTRDVSVAALKRLDMEKIEEYLEQRRTGLEQAGTDVQTVLGFIKRTYDLRDLASRPMLLMLIVDSVLEGVLDAGDTSTQFGPSGLYELYVQSKLDFDMDKAVPRREGLSRDTRLALAENMALEMYRSETLEMPLRDTLARIMDNVGSTVSVREFTSDQIETDFATCSFVTLGDDGACRFVHKSFRGFFVARALKESLRHPLLRQPLEREVLYFLGGFGPTERGVGDHLWSRFLHANKKEEALRRNLLVAYLYTGPEHDTRKIADALITDANFGRLTFRGTRLQEVTWQKCDIEELILEHGSWKNVVFKDSHIERLECDGSAIDVSARGTSVENMLMHDVDGTLATNGGSVRSCIVVDSTVTVDDPTACINNLEVKRSKLRYRQRGRTHTSVVKISDGIAAVSGAEEARLTAIRSCVSAERDCRGGSFWELEDSAMLLRKDNASADDIPTALSLSQASRSSVIVADRPAARRAVMQLNCGFFGLMVTDEKERVRRHAPRCWGVAVTRNGRDRSAHLGGLVLVTDEWYADAIRPDGQLSALAELLVVFADASNSRRPPDLMRLLTRLYAQYEKVLTRE